MSDPHSISQWSIYMGWALVVVTASLLYAVLHRQLQRSEKEAHARRQAVESLTECDLHLSTIQRTALDGFWLIDRAGRFLEVNETFCAMLGYRRDELLRMRIAEIEDLEKEADIVARVARIARKGWDRFETRHRRKDGQVIDVEVSVSYSNWAGGQFVCFCRDITERKRAERLMQQQKLLLREAGEIAHVGGWEFDPATLQGTLDCGVRPNPRPGSDLRCLHAGGAELFSRRASHPD